MRIEILPESDPSEAEVIIPWILARLRLNLGKNRASIKTKMDIDGMATARNEISFIIASFILGYLGFLRLVCGQLHRDHLGNPGLFHRDAVEKIRQFHGALVVRDEDEL